MQIVTKYKNGKTFQTITNETGIPYITVTKIYKTAMNKSIDLQILIDSPKIYNNVRRHGPQVHLFKEDTDAIYHHIISICENQKKTVLEYI